MLRLLKLFLDICLLQAKPQDLPSSRFLFGLAMAAAFLTDMPALMLMMGNLLPSLLAGVMDLFLTLVFLRGGLYIMEKDTRFQQTATAVFGASAIINLIALPLEISRAAMGEGDPLPLMAGLTYLALLIWSLIILGHILRHALDTRLGAGMAVAAVYYVLMTLLFQQFLPVVS